MKKVLDFSRVPLDKWKELHNVCDLYCNVSLVTRLIDDIEQLATTEVKEEADINAEIAQSVLDMVKNGYLGPETTVGAVLAPFIEQKKLINKAEHKGDNGGEEKT